MSSWAVSPASPIASPESAAQAQTSATSGRSSRDSFARLGPDGSWLKTCQGYVQANLDGTLEEYCETWPAQGMMQSGRASALPTWAPRTAAIAFGLSLTHKPSHSVPTPTASDHIERQCTSQQSPLNFATNKSVTLNRWVALWQTPVADDAIDRVAGKLNSRGEPKLSAQVKLWPTPTIDGSLNPQFCEFLMGLPCDWTKLE